MKKRIIRMAAAFFAAAMLLSTVVSAQPKVSAKSAVVMDADTGHILWEHNPHERALIASTTKIMTGLLVAEKCNLKDVVVVPAEAVGVEGSSIHLEEAERISVETLLYGMMLQSGNDAATALAIHCSGSIEAFAEAMNEKAAQLKLNNTSFSNPHGLDADYNYSTAYDLARLASAAMDNETFCRVVSQKSATFGNRTFTNHNRMLWQYDGAIGVKTGYTKAAGRILVSCAERYGRRLVAVTISAPDDWRDHRCMLDYGFSEYTEIKTIDASTQSAVPMFPLSDGFAVAVPKQDIEVKYRKGEQLFVCWQMPLFCRAPAVVGEYAGEIIVYSDDDEIMRVPLRWIETTPKGE